MRGPHRPDVAAATYSRAATAASNPAIAKMATPLLNPKAYDADHNRNCGGNQERQLEQRIVGHHGEDGDPQGSSARPLRKSGEA